MSELPEITLEELGAVIKQGGQAVKRLRCSDVINKNGDYLATLIVPFTDFAKSQASVCGVLSNSNWHLPEEEEAEGEAIGETVEEVQEAEASAPAEEKKEIPCPVDGCSRTFTKRGKQYKNHIESHNK